MVNLLTKYKIRMVYSYSSTKIGWADECPFDNPSYDYDCCVYATSDPTWTRAEVSFLAFEFESITYII